MLRARKPALVPPGGSVPRIEAVVRRCVVNARHLQRFCGLAGDQPGEFLPIVYPHLLASRLHLAVLGAAAFPVRLMGLVHLRNVIQQQRPLRASESFELRCGVDGFRATERGQEFDLETVAIVDGVQIWYEICTLLARSGSARALARARAAEFEPLPAFGSLKTSSFRADSDIGRRYARVSADFNLIHLSNPTARLFGFRRAIAHGMWSLARCATEIGANVTAGTAELEVGFRAAIPLPSLLTLRSASSAGGCQFALHGSHSEKPYLTGRLRVPE